MFHGSAGFLWVTISHFIRSTFCEHLGVSRFLGRKQLGTLPSTSLGEECECSLSVGGSGIPRDSGVCEPLVNCATPLPNEVASITPPTRSPLGSPVATGLCLTIDSANSQQFLKRSALSCIAGQLAENNLKIENLSPGKVLPPLNGLWPGSRGLSG